MKITKIKGKAYRQIGIDGYDQHCVDNGAYQRVSMARLEVEMRYAKWFVDHPTDRLKDGGELEFEYLCLREEYLRRHGINKMILPHKMQAFLSALLDVGA